MRIGDLGVNINEGILDTLKSAGKTALNTAGSFGAFGDEAKLQARSNLEYKKTRENFIRGFQAKFEQNIANGAIASGSQQQQQQQQQQQPPQPTPKPTQPVQQPQGQALDLDQLKQQRLAKQAQGQADQQAAMSQMTQTKQANATAAQADNELVAAVKAAKAKPGFQQTAQDKLTIQQGAAKGIHESLFDDYDLFESVLERAVDNQPLFESQYGSISEFVMAFIDAQQRSYGGRTGEGSSKYRATFEQLAKNFETTYNQTKKFPTEIAGKIFDYIKSEEQVNQYGDEYAGDVQKPMAGSTPSAPKAATTASTAGTTQTANNPQANTANPTAVATQALQDIMKANGNNQIVAAGILAIITASGVQDVKGLLAEIQNQAADQQATPPAQ